VEIAAEHLGELAPEDEPVPLDFLLLLPLAVCPSLVRREVDVGDLRAARCALDLGVRAEVAYESYPIDSVLPSECCP